MIVRIVISEAQGLDIQEKEVKYLKNKTKTPVKEHWYNKTFFFF